VYKRGQRIIAYNKDIQGKKTWSQGGRERERGNVTDIERAEFNIEL
jgi:hypothetical protein